MNNSRIQVIAFALLTLVSCGSLIYTVNARHESAENNQYLTSCLSALLVDFTDGSGVRSKAASHRDRALRDLINLRLVQQREKDDIAVAEATKRFNYWDDRLQTARKDQPVPTFDDYCKEKLVR